MPPENKHPQGAKPAHTHPLDDVSRAASTELLKELAEREKWGGSYIVEVLSEFAIKIENNPEIVTDKKLLNYAEFYPDASTIDRFIKRNTRLNDHHMWGIFLWLRSYYGNELEIKQLGEKLKQEEHLVRSLREMLGFSGTPEIEIVKSLAGQYKLYRPFHLDPHNKVMVSLLEIGGDGVEFNCTCKSEYTDQFGDKNSDIFHGKIVPHGSKLMAILTAKGFTESNLVLHFDSTEDHLDPGNRQRGSVMGMSGIVLTAVGQKPASAWPIFARRIKEDELFTPSVVDRSQESFAKPLRESLERGAVHWHQDHINPK